MAGPSPTSLREESPMTHKERILAAIDHKPPDRTAI